jgi:hypothetical protein
LVDESIIFRLDVCLADRPPRACVNFFGVLAGGRFGNGPAVFSGAFLFLFYIYLYFLP